MLSGFQVLAGKFFASSQATDQNAWMAWLSRSILFAVLARNVQRDGPDPRISNELVIDYGHAVLRRLTETMAPNEAVPAFAARVAASVECVAREVMESPDLYEYIRSFIAREGSPASESHSRWSLP